MISRALDAGVEARWVSGDEVYGADLRLRADLEGRGVGYVLAIGCDPRVTTPAGTFRPDELATRLPKHVWQRLSAGTGAKGHRFYDWAWVDIDQATEDSGHRWLLIRPNRRTNELAFCRCYAPTPGRAPSLGACRGNPVARRRILPKPAKVWPASISTRSAAGSPGIAGRLWRCSRTRSSPS